MNEQKTKTLNGPKNFSDSDICRNAERGKTPFSDEVNSASQEKKMVKLTGILTSRIETRNKDEPYYYGFFKIANQEPEIPVIFKKEKPTIPKGSEVQLTGNWANSNGSRSSFTCQAYQILKDPPHQVQINCFYNSKFFRCAFTTPESQSMEKHYRQKHYQKEVFHG